MRYLVLFISCLLASELFSQMAYVPDQIEFKTYVTKPIYQANDSWKDEYKKLTKQARGKKELGTFLIALSTIATSVLIATDNDTKGIYFASAGAAGIGYLISSSGNAKAKKAEDLLLSHMN